MAVALALAGAACSNGGSSTVSGGGLYGDGPSSTTAPSPTSEGSSTDGGAGSGHGGYGSGGGGDSGGGQSGGGGSALTVSQGNYLFSPSTPKVSSGDTIEVKNGTPDTPHTFTVEGEDIDVEVEPGSAEDVTIDLPPGTYPFLCRFHEAMGMTGTLKVS